MKKLILVLMATLLITSSAHAEEFTLTRGDGKVFTCSDQGGAIPVGPIASRYTSCDCFARGTTYSYGIVISSSPSDLAAACRSMDNTGVLQNCHTDVGTSLNCECVARGTTYSYGQVLGTTGTDAMAACRKMDPIGVLKSCKVQ